jgi:hypothetical protein
VAGNELAPVVSNPGSKQLQHCDGRGVTSHISRSNPKRYLASSEAKEIENEASNYCRTGRSGHNDSSSQSDVDATKKYAWGENVGWTNWRDAGNPAGVQGARVHATFLSGFVWTENGASSTSETARRPVAAYMKT